MVIYVDLETTGLDHKVAEIWEIGMFKVDGYRPVDFYQEIFNVAGILPWEIQQQSGINKEKLQGFPRIRVNLQEIKTFIGQTILIAYNAPFEQKFMIANNIIAPNHRFIDLYPWVREMRLSTKNNKLQTILSYYKIRTNKAHRALPDAFALYSLVSRLQWTSRIASVFA